MARLSDLKFTYRVFMQAYPYRQIEWSPGTQLRKPLRDARLAIVTTAAFHLPEQAPFDSSIRGGDASFREIPFNADLRSLGIAHKSDSFDHSGIEADPNLALPLERLRELWAAGEIGPPAPAHYSFMGSITAPGRLIRDTGPEVVRRLGAESADAVLLTPV
jgi:D-proline reductase (dithiol) PrdB